MKLSVFLPCKMIPWLAGRNRAKGRIGRRDFPTWKKTLMPYREMSSPEPGKERRDLILTFAFGNRNGHCTICWKKVHISGNSIRCSAYTFPFVSEKEIEQEFACWKERLLVSETSKKLGSEVLKQS